MKSQSDVLDLALALCAIPSISGDEAQIVDYLALFLSGLGFQVTRQRVGTKSGSDNLLALPKSGPVEILLTTHLDTVPPFIPPSRSDEFLHGRGTCDAKGIAAAMIRAVLELQEKAKIAWGCCLSSPKKQTALAPKRQSEILRPKCVTSLTASPQN
jgi:acetylornithine deacetylase